MAPAVIAFAAAPVASAGLADQQALAERYAPVVRLVEHTNCPPGKPYTPIDVDLLFGEPTVALRGPWGNDLVKIGPTAKDLAKGLYEYHLDFPGNALAPGCDYLRWDRRLTAGRARPDRLRARREGPGTSGKDRAPVLALLRLQRLEQPA
jgi:hypothetical protein